MPAFPLSEFFLLSGLAVFGAAAILPYAFALNREKLAGAKMSLPVLALLSFVQSAVIMAIAVGLGLLAAPPVGLGAPYIQAALAGEPAPASFVQILPLAIGLGALSFAAVALFERFIFGPHVPEALRVSDVNAKPWARFLASFYGGLDEEILFRLFLVSALVWILGRFWQGANGLPADGAYWTAIITSAVLFGLGHLPATQALTPLTPMLVARAVVLNSLVGIACGWLYWKYGLESAMVAHFSADILLHLIGPYFVSHIYKDGPKTQVEGAGRSDQ